MLNTIKTTHSQLDLPKPRVHAGHPLRNKTTHQKLLNYLQERLKEGKNKRDVEIKRLVRIDKDVSGWIKLSEQDKMRKRVKDQTGQAQATSMNLPLSFVHLDDMMTFYAETFAPSRGMFYQLGDPKEQPEAKQLVTKMNNDAIQGSYYRQVLRGIYSVLKYNGGGFKVEWGRDIGPKLESTTEGQVSIGAEVKWSGNRLKALDRYNFFYDPAVSMTDLHKDGEYAAEVELRSHFWLQRQAADGAFFNCEDALARGVQLSNHTYYRHPPSEALLSHDDSTGGSGSDTNWVRELSLGDEGTTTTGFELVHIYIHLNPAQFGLVPSNQRADRNRYEIWRFTILDDKQIIAAEHQPNAHGFLPFLCGAINDDMMGTDQKSVAEILSPLQEFASFLMNVHIEASRSNVWGMTVYDPSGIDLSKLEAGQVNARVPIKASAYGKDVRSIMTKLGGTLDTKQTLQDLEGVMGVINQFFPTQALPSQIASIERAVTSQVAAVQHGANRRQQKTARLLDDAIFSKIRSVMYFNIIQFMPDDSKLVNFYTGEEEDFDLSAMRQTNLPYIIGQGLKSIDRQATASLMQGLIFAMIQAPEASRGIDMLGLINYWTDMMDIELDMTQFRLQPPAPEGVEGQPTVDAAGNPIQPATNPAALSQPIYGRGASSV